METPAQNPPAEGGVVAAAGARLPVTRAVLHRDLAALGVMPGMTVLVHSALSRLGWVAGGTQTLILALQDAVTAAGTLVMPAQSGQLSDPSSWSDPPVPEAWWPVIRAEMPAYHPELTPTRGMGATAELFRTLPGSVRSGHPLGSFAARGRQADHLMTGHEPGCMFGEDSPLARLYGADARVLLLGVDHGNSTSLHLAEHRASYPGKTVRPEGAPMRVDGQRRWVSFAELDTRDDDFARVGDAFAAQTGLERRGRVGWGQGQLCPMRALVDFAAAWMSTHR